MQSKDETTNLEKDPMSLSRRNAILATGAGVIAAVGAIGASSQTNAEESSTNKTARNMNGKTSLITGGARGIGLASAIALAKEGSNIILYDVAEDLPENDRKIAGGENELESTVVKGETPVQLGRKSPAPQEDQPSRTEAQSPHLAELDSGI